jgi:aspartyl-tRNA(Asn)/glutamyl-tRNA(Gln) amidotransferase subunit B
MEKGEMRVEANISVAEKGAKTFGIKVEVKNLNSFRAVERAIAFEMKRHIDSLNGIGEKIVQETRGWDENKGATYSQRLKENSHDYRYFPDPDLPKLKISEIAEFSDENLKKEIPELPWEKRARYESDYGIKKEDTEVFVTQGAVGNLFEGTTFFLKDIKDGYSPESIQRAANYITSDLFGLARKGPDADFNKNLSDAIKNISPENFAILINMITAGELSSRGAKDTLAIMYSGAEKNPKEIAEKNGFIQKNDTEALTKTLKEIIDGQPAAVAEYKAGKISSLQFLIGQAMKSTKGSANPSLIKELLEKLLK